MPTDQHTRNIEKQLHDTQNRLRKAENRIKNLEREVAAERARRQAAQLGPLPAAGEHPALASRRPRQESET